MLTAATFRCRLIRASIQGYRINILIFYEQSVNVCYAQIERNPGYCHCLLNDVYLCLDATFDNTCTYFHIFFNCKAYV